MFEKASRGLAALALSTALLAPLAATAAPAVDLPTYRMGGTLEGNALAAYVAELSRDTTAAAAYYRQALRQSPQSPELMGRAFLAYLANNEMADAFRLAERLLKQDKQNNRARLALAIRDFQEHDFDAARKEFAAAQRPQQGPDFGGILLTAWAWTAEGNLAKGMATAGQLGANQTFQAYRDFHSGLMAMVSGNLLDAERLLKAAYEADSRTLRIVEAYGRILSFNGNTAGAIAVFEEYRKLAPGQPTVRWALTQLRAGRVLEPLVSTPNEGAAEVLYSLGDVGGIQGDELMAIIYQRLALYLNPRHVMARFSLAETNERIGQFEQSIALLRAVPENSPLSIEATVQTAYSLDQLGRPDDAQAVLDALATTHPKNGNIALALATIQRARAAKEKDRDTAAPLFITAAESYTKAIELLGPEGRSNWSLLFARGVCYERAKKWEKAEDDLKQALSLVPERQSQERAQVMNYLAYSWVDANKNIDEAFKMLQQAVELSPRDGMIIDSLGWAYFRLGRYQDAVRELEKSVAYKPGDPTINDHLGDAYWKTGRENDARFQWNHARDSNPEPDDLKKILDKIENGLK